MKRYGIIWLSLMVLVLINQGCLSLMMAGGLGAEYRKAKEEGKYMCGQPIAVALGMDMMITWVVRWDKDEKFIRNYYQGSLEGFGVGIIDWLIASAIDKLFWDTTSSQNHQRNHRRFLILKNEPGFHHRAGAG